MLRVSDDCVVRAAPTQVSADLEGEAAVLDTLSGVYWGLDEVGAAVWRHLREPVSVLRLRDALLSEFNVDRAACERDLLGFLMELREAGLLEVTTLG